ncbi:porin family protein [Luteibaculum oceani]|uniref:PorT family protein n=1 Tax=Luteibaculum oceani TaxID=1294296 RepID=A0A5C6VKH2_9FLAO|nr:outer membrane beta-barrel protein [Luteibaculum oceani]TXC85191.1 PorT family protein [Luteibaculum oceani]
MKKIYALFIVACFIGPLTQAQGKNDNKVDTTLIQIGERTQVIYIRDKEPVREEAYFRETVEGDILIGQTSKGRKKRTSFFTGIDLGINFMASGGNTSVPGATEWQTEPGKSLYWALNLAKKEFNITGNQYFMVGLGLNYRSFTPTDFYDISVTRDTTQLVPTSKLNPHKNKLRSTYIQIPTLFSFNTSRDLDRNFHISAGLITNLRIGAVYKQKYRLNGNFQKDKTRDDFNLSPILFDATVRVGFSSFTLFATYALTPLFEDGATQATLQPFAVGIQILGF